MLGGLAKGEEKETSYKRPDIRPPLPQPPTSPTSIRDPTLCGSSRSSTAGPIGPRGLLGRLILLAVDSKGRPPPPRNAAPARSAATGLSWQQRLLEGKAGPTLNRHGERVGETERRTDIGAWHDREHVREGRVNMQAAFFLISLNPQSCTLNRQPIVTPS